MAKETIQIRKQLRREKGAVVHTGPGLTEQAHKKECDMNYILRDYHARGMVRHVNRNAGRYDDIPVQDFQEAMFKVTEANKMFAELPADMRKEFGNDPGKFLAYVQNPENSVSLIARGLIKGNDGKTAEGEASGAPTAPAE